MAAVDFSPAKEPGTMATKAKSKKKSGARRAKKNPMIGHNSDEAASQEELRKIAKAQRSLDKEKASVKKDWRDKEKALTERLEKVGYTRAQFKAPYERFCEIADCQDDSEIETVKQNHIIFLAKQRKAFDALSPGETIDWIDMVQDADQIQKLREEAERKAAEEAADGADEPDQTITEEAA